MGLRAFLIAVLAAIVPSTPAAAAPQREDPLVYHARRGDNLYTLAERHLIRTADYRAVQRLNKISDPYRIAVGKPLVIPRRLLKFERLQAHIVAFRGTVRVLRDGQERQAAVGAQVAEGDALATSTNSFVTLRLPDQSIVALPSASHVVIHRLRRYSLDGSVERLFGLIKGRARAKVTPMRGPAKDDFRFSTPVSVSAVRGTEYRVSFDQAATRGTTEVLEGIVGVEPTATTPEREIKQGYGALSSAAGTTSPLALLAAPRLRAPGRVQDEDRLGFELEPLDGAAAYRVQVARDAGFLDVVSESLTHGTSAELDSVADGTWFVRVSALDANGLEGLPETYSFQRRLNRITTGLDQRRVGRYHEYLFRWQIEGRGARQYRFELRRAGEDGPALVDEPGLSTQRFIITDLPPGTYIWRVQTLQFVDGQVFAKWSATERLTIAADE
jgi:hypothetical protein